MVTFIVVALGNAVLYAMVRWFVMSEIVKNAGGANVPNVVALGVCCTTVEIFTMSNAMDMGRIETFEGKVLLVVLALACALPWLVNYLRLLGEMTDGMADGAMGLNIIERRKIDMKKAYTLIENGRSEEAVTELLSLKNLNPKSSDPIFVLASIAHSDREFEKEFRYYLEILENAQLPIDARINATRSAITLIESVDELERDTDTLQRKLTAITEEKEQQGARNRSRNQQEISSVESKRLSLEQARRLIKQGDFDAAVPILKSNIAGSPESPRTYFELISLYERQERHDDAILWLQKTIAQFQEVDLPWGDAMLRLAGLRITVEGDIESAMSLLELVSKRRRETKQGQLARTRIRELKKRQDDA